MSMYKPTFQGIYTVLASGIKAATQQFTRDQIVFAGLPNNTLAPNNLGNAVDCTGIVAYLNVTAVPGVDTVQLDL